MRIIAFTALALAATSCAATAQQTGSASQSTAATWAATSATAQQRLTPGQNWIVQQESIALNSPFRLSVVAAQLAQNRSLRQPPLGRPQRELR